MRSYRLLQIVFDPKKDLNRLYQIHKWELQNQRVLNQHCIKIMFTTRTKGSLEMNLFGFDGTLKWSANNMKDLHQINSICKNMSMTCRKSKNTNPCGIPRLSSTSHCFQDETHRTCCLLGAQARNYSNNSGNPIGQASERAFLETFGFYPDENTLTPWCTCIGSEVCSFYAKKFQDGTHIKYIDSLKHGRVVSQKEQKYKTIFHLTPGIL